MSALWMTTWALYRLQSPPSQSINQKRLSGGGTPQCLLHRLPRMRPTAAIPHLAKQSIPSITTALSITEVSHYYPVDDHVGAILRAVLHLANKSITTLLLKKKLMLYAFIRFFSSI
jgi:hypothetical protein